MSCTARATTRSTRSARPPAWRRWSARHRAGLDQFTCFAIHPNGSATGRHRQHGSYQLTRHRGRDVARQPIWIAFFQDLAFDHNGQLWAWPPWGVHDRHRQPERRLRCLLPGRLGRHGLQPVRRATARPARLVGLHDGDRVHGHAQHHGIVGFTLSASNDALRTGLSSTA